MNVQSILCFRRGEQALAWAVVEQAIYDYIATNDTDERDEILQFLQDYLGNSDTYNHIYNILVTYYG